MFLWYPEQQGLGNQVQLNSLLHTHTHTPLLDEHLAREVPILIKGLLTCVMYVSADGMFLSQCCQRVWTCELFLCVNLLVCVVCVCMSPI